jgi:hypothetical protein
VSRQLTASVADPSHLRHWDERARTRVRTPKRDLALRVSRAGGAGVRVDVAVSTVVVALSVVWVGLHVRLHVGAAGVGVPLDGMAILICALGLRGRRDQCQSANKDKRVRFDPPIGFIIGRIQPRADRRVQTKGGSISGLNAFSPDEARSF